jgi:hypothetical protein
VAQDLVMRNGELLFDLPAAGDDEQLDRKAQMTVRPCVTFGSSIRV